MATILRGTADPELNQVIGRLDEYERSHPGAEATAYRHNPASIRVRIIDDRSAGMSKSSRHREAWKVLAELPPDVKEQITVVLVLPVAELRSSLMNLEFEDPVPSGL